MVSGVPASGYAPRVSSDHADLAALIADTLAAVESMRRCGAEVLPVGVLEGLGDPPPPSAPQVRPAGGRAPSSGPAAAPRLDPSRTPRPEPPLASPGAPPAVRTPPWTPPAAPGAQARPVEAAAPQPRTQPNSPAAPARPPDATPSSAAGLFGSKWSKVVEGPDAGLAALRAEIAACRACPRCETRKAAVQGEGPAKALVLVVTDPPDAAGDQAGRALTGDAATMLDRMLLHVVRIDSREVQTASIVRCAGSAPTPAELSACRGFLERQVALAKPRAVLVLGDVARAAVGLDRHGTWGTLHGVPALSTFHPTHLLAHPEDKKITLAHLQELSRRVG